MKVLAIDPGPTRSAYVVFDDGEQLVDEKGILPNDEMHARLGELAIGGVERLVVEMIASYGMPVGKPVFETCVWIGRFLERWLSLTGVPVHRYYQPTIRLHLCGNVRAKYPHIRQALIDRFGPGKEAAIGKKKNPGPLYGVSEDIWSALALAVTFSDQWTEAQRMGGELVDEE